MITDKELTEKFRREIKKCGSVAKWLTSNNFQGNRGNISGILSGKRNITETIAKQLGYQKAARVWIITEK